MCPWMHHVQSTSRLPASLLNSWHNIMLWHTDVTSDITNHAHAAGHMTIWYKSGLHMVWVGPFTQDIQVVGSLKAHAGSNTSGASSWLEPTSLNCTSHTNLCFCHAHAVHHMCLSILEKPRSAAHSSISTPSTGLQCLLIGARVHLVWLELQVVTCGHQHAPMSTVHHNYWHPWVGANWNHTAQNVSLSPSQMQPESSSMATEKWVGSNALPHQWVYQWFVTLMHSWHST